MRGTRLWYVLCALIFITGIIGIVILMRAPQSEWVEILQEGNVIYHIDLSQAENQEITVEYHGGYNTLEIKDKKIRVLDADCPDKTCIHMGSLEHGGLPIVCMPNRLVIQFSDKTEYVDAVAG